MVVVASVHENAHSTNMSEELQQDKSEITIVPHRNGFVMLVELALVHDSRASLLCLVKYAHNTLVRGDRMRIYQQTPQRDTQE